MLWENRDKGALKGTFNLTAGFPDGWYWSSAQIGANQSGTFEHWVAVDRGYFDVKELNDQVKKIGVGALIATTADYWKNWSGRTQMSMSP